MTLRGLAIGGRMGSGKSWLATILKDCLPNSAVVFHVGDEVRELAIAQGLIPGGKVDKRRDRVALQTVRPPSPSYYYNRLRAKARAAASEGLLPIIADVRTVADERLVHDLSYPLIVVHAEREVRIRRIMDRDHATREEIESYIDDPFTEGYCDKLEAEFSFRNDNRYPFREMARLMVLLDALR